jgi:putative acetyltransferase
MITPASLPTDLPAITQLFRAYAASLPIDLGYQGFDGELAALQGTRK